MKTILSTLLIYVVIGLQSYFSQNLTFDKYSIRDGLPHNYTQSVFEDSKGFLWIGTVAGLVKYNGYEMKVFTMKDGLHSNNIININEDSDHIMWLATDKGVVKYENGIFTSYTLTPENIQSTKQIFISSKNEIHAANLAGVYTYNRTNDTFEPHPVMGSTYTRTIVEDKDNKLWFGGKFGLCREIGDTVELVNIPGPYQNRHNSIIASYKDFDENLWFGTASGFTKYEKDSLFVYNQSMEVEDIYISLFQAEDSSYIFGTYGGGFIQFKDPSTISRQKFDNNITSSTVHSITQSKGGSIWLATGDGILKTKYLNFRINNKLTDTSNLLINAITKDFDDNYWIATEKGVKRINSKTNNISYFNLSENANENNVLCMYSDLADSSIYFGTYAGRCFRFKNEIITPFADEDYWLEGHSIYGISKDFENNIWLSKNVRIVKCLPDTIITIELDTISNGAFEVLFDSFNKRTWFVGADGISFQEKGETFQIKTLNNVPVETTRQVEIDKNGILWFGTVSNGVFKYNANNEEQYTVDEGLSSNSIQSLTYDESLDVIWVGTIYGISKIKLDNRSNVIDIHKYTDNDLLDCNVNASFTSSKSGFLIAIENSIFSYKETRESINYNSPIIHISDILVFKEIVDFTEYSNGTNNNGLPFNLIMPHDKNHLTFKFSTIEFNQQDAVRYSIKLEGFDETWSKPNKERSVTYTNLPANSYILKIKAMNSNGLWSEEFEYSFTIDSPIYMKWWFIIGLILLFGFTAYYLINRKVKEVKTKALIEKNIAELELKALRAQMNPHFIFNVMNNIQNFVINEQPKKAVSLLGGFANLIRNILDISSEKSIILSKEVDFLTNFIELDLTQYPEKYTYSFSFSKNIDQDNLVLPPMLLQPFVENAIIHGLMHKESAGNLSISFVKKDDFLLCEIKDDGIGRKRSKEISENNHRYESKALNISDQRIKQFNTLSKSNQYSISIIDLKNEMGIGVGTSITIKLPLQYKY